MVFRKFSVRAGEVHCVVPGPKCAQSGLEWFTGWCQALSMIYSSKKSKEANNKPQTNNVLIVSFAFLAKKSGVQEYKASYSM